MTTLTNEDKLSILGQHKKNIEYNKYNLEVSLIEENAVSSPNQDAINSINDQVADLDRKMAALDAEAALLQ